MTDPTDAAIALTPEERAEELAFDISTAKSLMRDVRVAREALPGVSDNALLAECERRGWIIYWDRPSGRMHIGSATEDLP